MKKGYIIVGVVGAFTLFVKWFLWYFFLLHTLDYGIFMQAATNLRQFNWVEYYTHGAMTHFGVHFQPIIYLYYVGWELTHSTFVPQFFDWLFYLIFGLEIVYYFKNWKLPIVFWALNPIAFTIAYDAHPVNAALALVIPFIVYAERDEWKKAAVFAGLLFLVKEDAGLVLIGYAVYRYLKDHDIKKSLIIGGAGVTMISIAMLVVHEFKGMHFVDSMFYGGYPVLLSPFGVMALMVFAAALYPLGRHNKKLVFIGIVLVENFLSVRLYQITFGYQYFAYTAPIVAWALADFEPSRVDVWKYLGVTAAVALLFSPLFSVAPFLSLNEPYGGGLQEINVYAVPVYLIPSFMEKKSVFDKAHERLESISEDDGVVWYGYNIYPYVAYKYNARPGSVVDGGYCRVYVSFFEDSKMNCTPLTHYWLFDKKELG